MFHKDEAQRVIAISLGKIASYRNQRGGSSLHKNLLVANVLNKVRTFVSEDQTFSWERPLERICMPESSQLMVFEDCNMMPNPNENHKGNLRPQEESQVVFSKSGHVECPRAVIGSFEARDAVNGCGIDCVPISDYAAECEITSTDSPELSYTQLKTDSESRITYDREGVGFPKELQRPRCLKRRQEGSGETEDPVYAKRRKFDNEFNDTSWRLQPAISDTDSESENDCLDLDQETSASSQGDNSMDTEQISSLVSVFKCSFHGLGLIDNSEIGACEEEVTNNDYGYPNSHIFVQELSNPSGREGKPSALRRGLSLPDLCAKQADMCPTFQLTAPVLALTV